MLLRADKKEKHHINFDDMYGAWGLAGNKDSASAIGAGVIRVTQTTESQRHFGEEMIRRLDIDLLEFFLACTAIVPYYQGPLNAEIEAVLLRYTKTGEPELGGEHISAIINLHNGELLGLTKMLKQCDGENFVPHNIALNCTIAFLKMVAPELVTIADRPSLLMPEDIELGDGVNISTIHETGEESLGFSLGEVTVCWIDDHIEKLKNDDGVQFETHGMKVKMRFNDESERYVWVIVDKNSNIQVFERNIFWNFSELKRETQMWLHDGWLRAHHIGCKDSQFISGIFYSASGEKQESIKTD
jgi:hypothetical protein